MFISSLYNTITISNFIATTDTKFWYYFFEFLGHPNKMFRFPSPDRLISVFEK